MRVLIIGLDCLDPRLAFDVHAEVMPHLSRLRGEGIWGPLRSTIPPITVPAWSCMMSSRDPGQLGIYGFHNRRDYSYHRRSLATSAAMDQPRLWDLLTDQGKTSIVLGVPQTFPLPRRLKGIMVSGFLTPSVASDFICPREIRPELLRLAGEEGYMIDVEEFRTKDKARLLRDIYQITRSRFRIARQWIQDKPWDLFVMVEMGPDRMHHGFWRFGSPTHRLYSSGHPHEHAIRDYYAHLDQEIGSLLALVDDDVAVMVVSDHGAQDMVGGLCLNEWLIRQGYLRLKETPAKPTPFSPDLVDWPRTRAWGEGGYVGRLYLNVEGREPQGVVPQRDVERLREELKVGVEAIADPQGEQMGNVVHRPEEIYREVRNIAPDLMVYPGNLSWRAVGSVGLGGIHTSGNDTGPDDANHAGDGVFVLRDPERGATQRGEETAGLSLFDVAPTALDRLSVSIPATMIGKVIR